LAEEVGPSGKVYALDISEHEANIARKRIEKRGHKHVTVIHDPDHAKRIHPDVPKVHSAVSVGMIGYMKKKKKILKQLNKLLTTGAKVCFVDYDKFFDVIPNIEWLSDDKKIKRIFRDAGFHVDVFRKQGFAWKYIFIYGVKFKNV
jgi:cyclopropane fatty-acyl-phospholipid synthase-like methyltransferase